VVLGRRDIGALKIKSLVDPSQPTSIRGLSIHTIGGDAEWGGSTAYFNLLPAAQATSPAFSSVADQVQWEMKQGQNKK
jgi:hypothetical protein